MRPRIKSGGSGPRRTWSGSTARPRWVTGWLMQYPMGTGTPPLSLPACARTAWSPPACSTSDQWRVVPCLCRAGSGSHADRRRHRRHGQSRFPQGRRGPQGNRNRRRQVALPAMLQATLIKPGPMISRSFGRSGCLVSSRAGWRRHPWDGNYSRLRACRMTSVTCSRKKRFGTVDFCRGNPARHLPR